MRLSFLKIESFRKGIIFSSFFNFISKGLVFFQGLVIAYFFGAQTETDVYFYCFTTITLAAYFINSLDSSVIIPEAMRLKEQERPEAAMRLFNFFIYLYIAGGVLATIVFYISPVNIILSISRFEVGKLEEARQVLLLSVPLFALIITTNFLANILASYRYFTMPMMVSAINGIFALLFLVLFHQQFGISSILIGTITAYILNLCFLLYMLKKQLGWHFTFERLHLSSTTKWNILMAQVGNFTSAFSNYVPFYLLSSFGPGVLTALSYGQKTADVPQQLINLQFAAVAGIRFNELNAKGDFGGMDSVFFKSASILFAILIPISAFMFVYNAEIITILFKHGQFSDENVAISGVFLKYFALVLPFYATNNLIARLFMAHQKIIESFWYQVAFNGVLIISYFFIVREIGYVGLPVTMAIMYFLNFLACYFLAKWFFPYIDYKRTIKAFGKTLLVNAIPIALLVYFNANVRIDNVFLATIAGGSIFLPSLAILYVPSGIHRLILRSKVQES
jgi:putative peptidoglycan lipid II flippase